MGVGISKQVEVNEDKQGPAGVGDNKFNSSSSRRNKLDMPRLRLHYYRAAQMQKEERIVLDTLHHSIATVQSG